MARPRRIAPLVTPFAAVNESGHQLTYSESARHGQNETRQQSQAESFCDLYRSHHEVGTKGKPNEHDNWDCEIQIEGR